MSQLDQDLELAEQGHAAFARYNARTVFSSSTSVHTSAAISQPLQDDIRSVHCEDIPTARGKWLRYIRTGVMELWRSMFQWIQWITSHRGGGIEVTVRSLEKCNTGYPKLATFLDSDEAFMIYRRFGFLQARVLLDKQAELCMLENELDEMDQHDLRENRHLLETAYHNDPGGASRTALLRTIDLKLNSYTRSLLYARQLHGFDRPLRTDYMSLVNFIGNETLVDPKDIDWIYAHEDLVTFCPRREHAWLNSIIERLLGRFQSGWVEYIFSNEEIRKKTNQPMIHYYTTSRINRLARTLVNTTLIVVILVLLVVPVYLLWHITNSVDSLKANPGTYATCIGVLLGFTLGFSAILALFTQAKQHEILASSVAYCAILVVFLGNLGPT